MSQLNESDLVSKIEKLFSHSAQNVITGIGDDCAVIKPSVGHEQLITTDTLAQGVHFKLGLTGAKALGAKSAAVSLSDIASMGGAPKYLLLSMSLTKSVDDKWITQFLKGFEEMADNCNCVVIGGNITSAKRDLSFTITAIGDVKRGKSLLRNNAKAGDHIYVTGTPGDSALGLDILLSKTKAHTKAERTLTLRHLSPTPRIKWGQALGEKSIAASMIDISDGFALDLSRLCKASDVAANICLACFPISKEAKTILDKNRDKTWERILSGGEDYELLFTVRPGKQKAVERLIGQGAVGATCVGKIVASARGAKERISINNPNGSIFKLKKKGWVHGKVTPVI